MRSVALCFDCEADWISTVEAFVNTSSFGRERKLDNLPAFLREYGLSKKGRLMGDTSVKGAPHTLVITGAGLRAADLTRYLPWLYVS